MSKKAGKAKKVRRARGPKIVAADLTLQEVEEVRQSDWLVISRPHAVGRTWVCTDCGNGNLEGCMKCGSCGNHRHCE